MRFLLSRLACVAAAAAIWTWASLSLAEAVELRVATFRCDVTPPLGFLTYPPTFKPLEEIEHPLLAKGIVLDDGARRYVLCAIDWCALCNSTYDLFRRKVAEGAGTEPTRVAVHTIHQHTAPVADNDAYRLLLQTKDPPACPDLKFFDETADRLGAVREGVARPAAAVRSYRHRRGQGRPGGFHPAAYREGRQGASPPLEPCHGQGSSLERRARRADRSDAEDDHSGPRRQAAGAHCTTTPRIRKASTAIRA